GPRASLSQPKACFEQDNGTSLTRPRGMSPKTFLSKDFRDFGQRLFLAQGPRALLSQPKARTMAPVLTRPRGMNPKTVWSRQVSLEKSNAKTDLPKQPTTERSAAFACSVFCLFRSHLLAMALNPAQKLLDKIRAAGGEVEAIEEHLAARCTPDFVEHLKARLQLLEGRPEATLLEKSIGNFWNRLQKMRDLSAFECRLVSSPASEAILDYLKIAYGHEVVPGDDKVATLKAMRKKMKREDRGLRKLLETSPQTVLDLFLSQEAERGEGNDPEAVRAAKGARLECPRAALQRLVRLWCFLFGLFFAFPK
ncbi:unnamed protein product, partial [Effrenium voratum]